MTLTYGHLYWAQYNTQKYNTQRREYIQFQFEKPRNFELVVLTSQGAVCEKT